MSNGQKMDDLLSLSMVESEEALEDSSFFDAGIDEDGLWEIIIKYHGDILKYESELVRIEILSFEYAIVTLKKEQIESFVSYAEVEYAEKPKEIYAQDLAGNVAGCMPNNDYSYTGKGVCVAIIDSGLDVTLNCFRNADGKSRVKFFYDQKKKKEYYSQDIDAILSKDSYVNQNANYSWDPTGHGTKVAAIAVGNGIDQNGVKNQNLIGAAPEAEILVVKLDTENKRSFPLTTSIMRAFDYAYKKCIEMNQPMVINLSFGSTYGAHDGTSLLEAFIDDIAKGGRICICVGAGNEGAAGGHTGGVFKEGETEKSIFFNIGRFQKECSLQIWSYAMDQYEISLKAPNGEKMTFQTDFILGKSMKKTLQTTQILLYIGTAQPYSIKKEVFIAFKGEPDDALKAKYMDAGMWELNLKAISLKCGNYDLYLPASVARSEDTVFLQPTPDRTITIPACAKRVIAVGAYNLSIRDYAEFSGRGTVAKEEDEAIFSVKPDLIAVGVGVLTITKAGIERVSGTSFATPFVAGAVARLMEEGIVEGADPYMYGEKCKAYLLKNAVFLPSQKSSVDNRAGFGALCAKKFKNEG